MVKLPITKRMAVKNELKAVKLIIGINNSLIVTGVEGIKVSKILVSSIIRLMKAQLIQEVLYNEIK